MPLLSQKRARHMKEGTHLASLSLGVIPNPHVPLGSWRHSGRHTHTDIRNQSPVILGLVGLLLWYTTNRTVASCVPHAIPPDQKYNPLGALSVSFPIVPS